MIDGREKEWSVLAIIGFPPRFDLARPRQTASTRSILIRGEKQHSPPDRPLSTRKEPSCQLKQLNFNKFGFY
jgi:hypothetical protein